MRPLLELLRWIAGYARFSLAKVRVAQWEARRKQSV